jgi:hypothetical protein
MALNTTQVTQLTDSISQALNDFNTAFVVDTAGSTPSSSTIVTGVSGTTTTNTLGRVLNYVDIIPELNMLTAANVMATQVTAYIGGLQAITGFYPQFYALFNALDLTLSGGLNAYLTTNSLQVNARFAIAFNYWAAIATAVTPGRTSANIPTAIATANFFPYAAIDTMWGFTANGATTFSANAVGSNTTTAVSGGGVGQFYLYKVNATNAIGGATFTITYTKADTTSTTATYSTTSGVPLASGSLSAGYSISGMIGSAVTAVTATGMTSGEQYVIGMKIVRALSGY